MLPTDPSWLPRRWALLLLAVALVLTAAARLIAIDAPLERDEGEYGYAGQLLLQGVPPYAAAYNMKFPGIYMAYALMMAVFGDSTRGVHLGLLAVNLAAILLVYALGTWLSGRLGGVVAAASYAILSTSPSVLGLAAHATHFIVVPALLGIWLLLRARDGGGYRTLFAGGLCLGLAVLMKQHAAFFAVFGLADALWSSRVARGLPWSRSLARVAAVGAGIVVPVAATVFYLLGSGVLERFWFWTVQYARIYAGELSPLEGASSFASSFPFAVGPSILLWLLAGAGAIAIWLRRDRRDQAAWVSGLTICSFLATVPGFWFRPHYFIVLLPAVAMLAGVAVVSLREILMRNRVDPGWSLAACAMLFGLTLAAPLDRLRSLLSKTPDQMSREVYGLNPFPEAVEISRYIAAHSEPTARIAVLGSEPQVYFHARRRSATGYIYTYALVEVVRGSSPPGAGPAWVPQPYARRMHDEMIREIEAARPEYAVFMQVRTSWMLRTASEQRILQWFPAYLQDRYELVGVADILSEGTEYRWEEAAAGYTVRSSEVVYVFRLRKPGGATTP